MDIQENIIRKYFNAWISKEYDKLISIFSEEIVYSECYGPEYHGINQIEKWFYDWNKRGTVRQWDVKQCISIENITIVEWYFKCEYDNVVDGFDGVSIVKFNDDNKITELKEFKSNSEHYFPYEK